jgi:hypothetical protein
VTAVAAVGDDAGEARADLGLDLRDHGLERIAVVWFPAASSHGR